MQVPMKNERRLKEVTNMAKDKTTQVDETEVEEAPKGIRPKELAKELEVDPKTLRGYLRKEFPRSASEKNTSWVLSEDQAAKAREHFADDEDESDEDDE
jgi:hypothetical protein